MESDSGPSSIARLPDEGSEQPVEEVRRRRSGRCVPIRARHATLPAQPMPTEPPIVIAVNPLDRAELARLVRDGFGDMVKFVVDVRRRVVAVGGQLHADGESLLLADGSAQDDLWGANYYPGRGPENCIEYSALINIRPATGNRGMTIEDATVRGRVRAVATAVLGNGEPL